MCDAAAHLLKGDQEELGLESVDILEYEDDCLKMVNIFGAQKILKAKIKTLSLVEHKIILELV